MGLPLTAGIASGCAGRLGLLRQPLADQYGFRAAEVFPAVLELFRNIVSITEFMSTVALNADPITITPETRAAVRAAHTWTYPDTLVDPENV
jgi:hypothetical protein